jgi:hypothetical protein
LPLRPIATLPHGEAGSRATSATIRGSCFLV